MIDSSAMLCVNRSHIFDPVGLIKDRYALQGFRGESAPLRFVVEAKGDGFDSDASSPRLWKTSPAGSPWPESCVSQQPMSPDSRTQAIARGRGELMEMIKDLPESFYELSLRDIVDQNCAQIAPSLADADDEKRLALAADPRETKEKKKVKKTLARSRSFHNGGYLLKTSVFPFTFGLKRSKKKQKKSLLSSGSWKVGPTPVNVAAKSAEKEWWRSKRSEESDTSGGLSCSDSGSSSRSSSRSSSTSTTTSSRRGQSSRFFPGCCAFRNR